MADSKKEIAVRVEHLTKTFRIPTEASSGIKQRLINLLKGKKGYREFTPLRDMSFTIEKGDFFGIVGRNGSGKSTLLKTIADIYSPTKGLVEVEGTLVPFIELGVGFNQELTGRENVYLNGALLGFSHAEMEAMYDEIVDFAEIGDFMEEKLKNYSSGMQVRLAFSIAIKAKGDILLLDEVLAVGDEAFQRKCFEYFAKLKKEKRTVILVTHDMNSVSRFCNKAMLINQGKVMVYGDIKKVVRGYEDLNRSNDNASTPTKVVEKRISDYGGISVVLNGQSKGTIPVARDQELNFDIKISPKKNMEEVFMGFTIQKSSGEYVYWYTTEEDTSILGSLEANKSKNIQLEVQNIFGNGEYSVNINIKKNDRTQEFIVHQDAIKFEVSGWNHLQGWMYHPKVSVKAVDS